MNALMTLRAQVRRRLLVTYRLDPAVAQGLVPAPFRPQLVDGSAVAGICVIGLRSIRPGWFRPRVGLRSENIAHRIAVEWSEQGRTRSGVYILERHSSSLLPVLAGGRLFPGVQRHALVEARDSETRFQVRMTAPGMRVAADVELGGAWTSTLFPTVQAASAFYEAGSVGWSPRRNGTGAEPLRLTSSRWSVEPAQVLGVESSFFESLPDGAAVLDSVVAMRDLPFFWAARDRAGAPAGPEPGGRRNRRMRTRRGLLLLGAACAVVSVAAPAVGALFEDGSPVRFLTLPVGMLGMAGAFAFVGAGVWASDRKPPRGEGSHDQHR